MEKKIGIAYTSLSWWVCVLSGRYLEGNIQTFTLIAFVFLSLVLHLKFYVKDIPKFFGFYFIGLTLGLVFDGALLKIGWLSPTTQSFGFFPLWLLALWLVFPLNFLHTLSPFSDKKPIAIVFGLIGGPLAYKAGPSFEILELNSYWWVAEGLFWAFYMIVMGHLEKKWLRHSTKQA